MQNQIFLSFIINYIKKTHKCNKTFHCLLFRLFMDPTLTYYSNHFIGLSSHITQSTTYISTFLSYFYYIFSFLLLFIAHLLFFRFFCVNIWHIGAFIKNALVTFFVIIKLIKRDYIAKYKRLLYHESYGILLFSASCPSIYTLLRMSQKCRA